MGDFQIIAVVLNVGNKQGKRISVICTLVAANAICGRPKRFQALLITPLAQDRTKRRPLSKGIFHIALGTSEPQTARNHFRHYVSFCYFQILHENKLDGW